MVATPSGERAIESLEVGDEVLSVSVEGNVERGRVVRIVKHILPGAVFIEHAQIAA
jgi:hypothetical protein